MKHMSGLRPNLQLVWDNTSLSLFKTCPRKYQYAILEGWVGKSEKPALTFGKLLHAGLEVYDHARHEKRTHQEALRDAVKALLCKTSWKEQASDETSPPGPPVLRFWQTDDANRTRVTLIRSLIWYCEQFAIDPLETVSLPDGTPAIELSVTMDLDLKSDTGESYAYCGHIDKVVNYGGNGIFVMERKHTKGTVSSYYFQKYEMSSQVTGYVTTLHVLFNLPVQGAIIDACQVAVNFTRPNRSLTVRSADRMEEWLRDTKYWIKQAEACAVAGYWPQNHESCDKYGACHFIGVCSKAESIRKMMLETDFMKQIWLPLEGERDGEAA